MRPLIILALAFILNFEANAQEFIAITNISNVFADFRKVSEHENEEHKAWSVNDSIMHIPAYDLYCDWTSERVHPVLTNKTKLKGTKMIALRPDSCSFVAPYIGSKTSDFGYRRYRYHYGVDIKLNTGDDVVSAFEGVVRVSHHDGDYGKVVVVRHNNGLETLYAHLSKLSVKPGDWVEAGETVGLGGSTGRSTGPHLHFEVRYLGDPINPNSLIDWESGTLKMDTLALNNTHFEYLKEVRAVKYHTVRKGETLSAIARKHGTSVSTLCKLNKIRSSTTLRIGQKLRTS